MVHATIRNAMRSDIPHLASLLKEINYNDYVKDNTTEIIEKTIISQFSTLEKDSTHKLLIAEDINQNLVGYCMIHVIPHLFLKGPEVYISDLFIKPSFRGNEIGTHFIEYTKEFALKNNCSRLGLLNGRERESYKRSFYAKKGFIERSNLANFIYPL